MDEFTTATGCHLTVVPHEPTGHTLLLLRMDDGRRAEVVLDPAAYAWLRSAPPAPPADLVEQAAKVIDRHQFYVNACSCGWLTEGEYAERRDASRAHLAAAVLGALDLPGLLNAAKAEALRDAADDLEQFEPFPGEEPDRLREIARDLIEKGDADDR